MRTLAALSLALVVLGASQIAHAGFVLEASLGAGMQLRPDVEAEGQSVMIAPGFALLGEMLRAELGVAANRQAVEGGEFEFQLRPMLVIDPPLLPFYVRAVAAVADPFSEDRQMAYGGMLGAGMSLFGLGVFGEAGYLPRFVDGVRVDIAEARVGGYFAF